MINATTKNEFLSQFVNNSKEMFESVKENYNLIEAMDSEDVDAIRGIVRKVQSLMIANIPDGLSIPKASLYVSPTGSDTISIVNITVSNKISADKAFSYSTVVTREKAIEKVLDFMISVYSALIVDELVSSNLVRVNDVLAKAATEAGIEYGIKVVSSLGYEGKKIASMTDDEIVFVADEERVFALDDIIVLFESATEDISEEVIQAQHQNIVDELTKAQTPEQLVGIHGGMLVAYVCDLSKRLKPMTLIKKVCSKNVAKIRGDKDTIAYYYVNDVFALVARRDGHYEVVLAPFDVNTLRKVDVDILKEIA